MKNLLRPFVGLAAAALFTLGTASGQDAPTQPPPGGGPGGPGGGGRNWDPAQFQKMMMDRYREQLGVKDDEEWKLIETRIQKVADARQAVGFRGMGGPGGRRGPGGPGGQGGQGGGRRGMGAPNPDAEALQKAIDDNASADTIKAKLEAYRASTKANEAKLESAQEELRKVLSVKQEAAAVMAGLLK